MGGKYWKDSGGVLPKPINRKKISKKMAKVYVDDLELKLRTSIRRTKPCLKK